MVFAKGAAKHTVCTITINSSNEAELFKKRLSPRENFEFIELVPKKEESSQAGGVGGASGGGSGGKQESQDAWFTEACKKLSEEKKACDLLVISGHFGGSFFGSSGKRLTLETLEEAGCNNACPAIMNKAKEAFFFGCNTLAGKEKDHRTPEQYRALLRSEVNEQGNRIFTDNQVEEIVAFRYSEFGHSNRERMSRAFRAIPYLYGFDSVAPSGKNAMKALNQYFNSIPNYSEHLSEIERITAVGTGIAAITSIGKANKTPNRKLEVNTKLRDAFLPTSGKNFIEVQHVNGACNCALDKDHTIFCELFDKNLPLVSRIQRIKALLTGPEGMKYFALAKQFFEKNPVEKFTKEEKEKFQEIQADKEVREKFSSLLKVLQKMPVLQLGLVDLGARLEFLSPKEADSYRGKILIGLLNQGTLEAKDTICSIDRNKWPEIESKDLKPEIFRSEYSLEAMASCIPSLPQGLTTNEAIKKELGKSLSHKAEKVRGLSAWILGEMEVEDKEIHKELLKLLKDKDDRIRGQAAGALHRIKPQDLNILKEIMENFKSEKDEWIRRDLVFALAWSKSKNQEKQSFLEKAKEDSDEIVREIAEFGLRERKEKFEPPKSKIEISTDILCKDLDPKTTDIDAICKTSKGIVFKRIKDPNTQALGWQDQDTKTIWYDEMKAKVNHYAGEIHCEDQGQFLPSSSDFLRAEKNGFREIVPNIKNQYFWSASLYPGNKDVARLFDGVFGGPYYDSRGYAVSVRCVGR